MACSEHVEVKVTGKIDQELDQELKEPSNEVSDFFHRHMYTFVVGSLRIERAESAKLTSY